MNEKDEFLKIRSYEEYDKRRHEFKDLDFHDKEIHEHFNTLFLKQSCKDWKNGIMTELYKDPVKRTMS